MIVILANGTAILEDGSVVPVVAWIDRNGDQCTIDDAAFAVYGTNEKGFGYSKLTEAQRITWH